METLRKQIARARRRLLLQSFVGKLAWCCFATLLVAVAAIGAEKLWPGLGQAVGSDLDWAIGALGIALALGAVAAVVWTWLARQDALDAAREIDRRFALKERVASTLALDAEQLQSDIGHALVHDTTERIRQVDMAERFGVRVDRRALLPLAPAGLALALCLFVNGRTELAPAATTASDATQIKKSAQMLAKKLDTQQKQAEEQGLEEAGALLKQLEQATKTLTDKTQTDRKQTLVTLNDLAKTAEKRRDQLSGNDLKQQLNRLKNMQQGPAEKLAGALKNGDLKKAVAELDKLKDQLAGDKLDPKMQQELAKQLDQMQQALEKMVQAHKQAMDDLKNEIEKERAKGNVAEADKLQQQLDKLAQKAPQMKKLDQLAQQLKQAAQNCENGQCKDAAAALGKLSEQLAGMQKEMDELAMLDDALTEISDCKNSMSCKECQGEGCKACQGVDFKLRDEWRRQDWAKGGGRGAGAREKQAGDTDFYDSQVKPKVGKGASTVIGVADGPNRKGQVQEEIKSQFSNGEQQAADALSGQRLPHEYRDHTKAYFDALREGQK